jgi:hypothetical protein
MDSVKCPHCGKQVELSEAIIHELQEEVRNEESKKLKAQFEEEKAKETAKREKELREEFEKTSQENTKLLIEAKKKEEILLEKMAKDEEDRRKNEEKIRAEALKEASKDMRLEKLEYEKKISDMQKALEEAQRKGKQGSQQLQGEVLELDFEERLKKTFPGDHFLPVPKGVEGGDIWQKVKFNGKDVGSIIWETKRTKAWSRSWLTKLKDDAGKISATEAIIVSQALPSDVSSFDRKEGVWVTDFESAINICRYVRFLITSIANAKSSADHSEEEWGMLRDYMTSDAFKHRMQAHFDGVKALKDTLEAEKRATTLKWKKQEVQINKLDMNTTNFYGELKAIVSNLPELDEIEGTLIADGHEEDTTLL